MRQLPHVLTISRLAASPVLVWLLLGSRFREALALAVLAGLTDWLDGFLARRLHLSGRLGVILDPIADKVLLVTAFVALGYVQLLPTWMVYLAVGRDVIIVAGALLLRVLRGIRTFLPSPLGKVSTFFQIVLVLVVLLEASLNNDGLFWLRTVILFCAAFSTAASGADYVRRGVLSSARRTPAAP